MDGLKEDSIVFEVKASSLKKIGVYLTEKFPTVEAFNAKTPVDKQWHGEKVMLGGAEITIICKPTSLVLRDGCYWVIGQSVEASGNSTVEAWDNSTVKAWGNSTVKASDNSTVKAWDNSTVEASDNSTVVYPTTNWWHGKVSTTIKDQAVLIDRRNGKLVITTACDVEVKKEQE